VNSEACEVNTVEGFDLGVRFSAAVIGDEEV